jgi:hypothetical protein
VAVDRLQKNTRTDPIVLAAFCYTLLLPELPLNQKAQDEHIGGLATITKTFRRKTKKPLPMATYINL